MRRDPDAVLKDVREMRARLHGAKQAQHWLDVGAGPGGLQDIDLLAQSGVLRAGRADRARSAQLSTLELDDSDREKLEAARQLFWSMRTVARLVFGETMPEEIGSAAAGLFDRVTGHDGIDALERSVGTARRTVEEIVSRSLAD